MLVRDRLTDRPSFRVQVKVIYNKFLTVISYEASALEIYSTKALEASPAFAAYEVESEELAGDLSSFALANAIYAGLVEGYAAEISARRNAMENASKNAVRSVPLAIAHLSLGGSASSASLGTDVSLCVPPCRTRWVTSTAWFSTACVKPPSPTSSSTSLPVPRRSKRVPSLRCCVVCRDDSDLPRADISLEARRGMAPSGGKAGARSWRQILDPRSGGAEKKKFSFGRLLRRHFRCCESSAARRISDSLSSGRRSRSSARGREERIPRVATGVRFLPSTLSGCSSPCWRACPMKS